jgi:four helix bundle protein
VGGQETDDSWECPSFEIEMPIKRFEELEVWQAAHRIVLDIYKVTSTLPSDEKYGLTAQMRRAAVSVPANIAEGFKRRGRNDKVHFYNIAQSSLEEVRYYLILCRDLGFKIEHDSLPERTEQVGRMLHGLMKSVSLSKEI